MQLPPPASSSQWGSSPHDPASHGELGYGGRPVAGSHGQPGPGYGGPPTFGGYREQPPSPGYGAPPSFNRPPTQPGPGSGFAQNGYGQQLGYGPLGWGD